MFASEYLLLFEDFFGAYVSNMLIERIVFIFFS